jgi:signal transduction histidine kinase
MAAKTSQSTATTDEHRRADPAGGALAGGGDMGERVRMFDWASTSLGPISDWPQSLCTAVGIMLNSRYPIAIYWGQDLTLLYNDAWSPIAGSKHPWALGKRAREVWPEIWSDIEPLFQQAMVMGEGTWSEDRLLPMHRHGSTEECSVTFSPIRGDDGSVGGVFNAVVETSARAFEAERERARALAELDRAKTTFFSNVSHELRTPLTLMLAPTEELLRNADGNLSQSQMEQLAMLHRNEVRLLELIDTLPEFSRLDAGRVDATFEPANLAMLTSDLLEAERTARVEAERARARTEQLRRLSTDLAGARTPAEVAEVTISASMAGVGTSRMVVLRLVEQGKYFALVGSHGYADEDIAAFEFISTGTDLPVSDAVTSRRPVMITDTRADETRARYQYVHEWGQRTGVRAIIVFPLLAGSADEEHALGTVSFEFDEPFMPGDDDLAFFDGIARVAAQAMDRAFAYEQERGLRFEADAARLRAEDANRIKGDFLAAMSHELRTPLNAIAGHTQLIEMGVHGPVTDAQLDALARIQRGQEHLLALINDVLNYAKLEAGRVEFQSIPLVAADAVREVLAMMEPQIAAKGIATVCRVSDDLSMLGDAEKVAQVLLNLLSNALKFTDTGGIITIEAESTPSTVQLKVVDTGCGIPADKFDAIFEPFVQVHRSLSRNTEGTGLGLSISRDLARGMGGELSVRSTVDVGSTFTLTMPAAR